MEPGTEVTVLKYFSNSECFTKKNGNTVYGSLDFNNGEPPTCTPTRSGLKAAWRDYLSLSYTLHFIKDDVPTSLNSDQMNEVFCITKKPRLGRTEIIDFEKSEKCPFSALECHPEGMTSSLISKSSVMYNFKGYLLFKEKKNQ
ncbi:MAG: hypothetical protein KA715_07270 [Xanthomonadaceae bacterium]|nr:hypothetical protein [Xanthomonadaceae bacterium]